MPPRKTADKAKVTKVPRASKATAPTKKKSTLKKKESSKKKEPSKKKHTTKKNVEKSVTKKSASGKKSTSGKKHSPSNSEVAVKKPRTYKEMTLAAVKALRSGRKGVSVHAIFKFLMTNYQIEAPNQPHLKRTLKLAVEEGYLKREKGTYRTGTKELKLAKKRKTKKASSGKEEAKEKKSTPKKTAKKTKKTPKKTKKTTVEKVTKPKPIPTKAAKKAPTPKAKLPPQQLAAPRKNKEVIGLAESQGDDLEDVFEGFFEEYEEFRNQSTTSAWHSEEARKGREEKRQHLWKKPTGSVRGGQGSIPVVDVGTLPTLDSDPRRVSVRGMPSFLTHAPELEKKISIYRGTIYHLNVDAVVNATDTRMSGGGGLDHAIHSAAGRAQLQEEIQLIDGPPVGFTEITRGYYLPARYIFHSVGPTDADARKLASCYTSALDLAARHDVRTIAFPCIATGSFGFPIQASAQIALQTVRRWLETPSNESKIDRIVFVMFREEEEKAYLHYVSSVFPPPAALPVRQLIRTSSLEKSEAAEVRQNTELMNQWLPKRG